MTFMAIDALTGKTLIVVDGSDPEITLLQSELEKIGREDLIGKPLNIDDESYQMAYENNTLPEPEKMVQAILKCLPERRSLKVEGLYVLRHIRDGLIKIGREDLVDKEFNIDEYIYKDELKSLPKEMDGSEKHIQAVLKSISLKPDMVEIIRDCTFAIEEHEAIRFCERIINGNYDFIHYLPRDVCITWLDMAFERKEMETEKPSKKLELVEKFDRFYPSYRESSNWRQKIEKFLPIWRNTLPKNKKSIGRPKDPDVTKRVEILRKHKISGLDDLNNEQKRLNLFADLERESVQIPSISGTMWLELHRNPDKSEQLKSVIETLRKSLSRR